MKGLAIYSIVALSIFLLGMAYNIADGTESGYAVMAAIMLAPIMVFSIMYVSKYK
jgi:hypothetical protein